MTAPGRDFDDFVVGRSTALLRTAVLLCGGDVHAGEDLLQQAAKSPRRARPAAQLRVAADSRPDSHSDAVRLASPGSSPALTPWTA